MSGLMSAWRSVTGFAARRWGLTAVIVAAITGPAIAETTTLNLDSDFGPLQMVFDWSDNSVSGTYPKYDGSLSGKLVDGVIKAAWWQPKGEHPCSKPLMDTLYWGYVLFDELKQTATTVNMNGKWGNCEEQPTHPWKAFKG